MTIKTNLKNYGSQDLSNLNFNFIQKSINNNFITNDKLCLQFEKQLCKKTRSKYSVVCNNGTSALMMAILASNLIEIVAIVPNINFVSVASIVSLLKGKIIFCDVNENTGMVDIKSFNKILKLCRKKKIKPNLFIPIHYAGDCLDLKEISQSCKKNKILIIEDGCHSFGSRLSKNEVVGSSKRSLCTTFSFHPVKNITTVEGGAITTNNKKFYLKLLEIRSHSLKRTYQYDPYILVSPSLNFRMGEINAAIGIEQLKNLKKLKKKRQNLVNYYIRKFKDFSKFFKILNYNSKDLFWHLFVIRLNQKFLKRKGKLMKFLKNKKIGSQIHYKPLMLHKSLKKTMILNDSNNSLKFYKSQLTLPLHTKMNKNDIDHLTKTLKIFFSKIKA